MTKYIKLVFLCVCVLLAAACGDDLDGGNNGVIYNPDTGDDDATEQPDGGADAGPDAEPDADDDGGNDADGSSNDTEGASCANPTALGALSAGQEHRFNATLVEPASSLEASCELGSSGSGVHVFSVEVEEASRVEFWTNASPSIIDLRQGGCANPSEVLSCVDGGRYTANLEAGQTYHLIIWGDINAGDIQVRANVQQLLCSVNEPDWCEAGELNECVQNISVRSFRCADGCEDEASCSADLCASAINVDLSGGTTVTYSGDTGAYTNQWSADQRPNCGFVEGDTGADTQFAESFFEVSGLTAGQELTVESTSSGDYAFYVLQDCSASECLAALDSDDSGNQRMVWEVPADGSYTVVIESLAAGDRAFDFEFSAQ